ncbi:unnamed protein product [Peronospora farinosa]|uniref:Spen paralogue and orthologue SPOC C-terminal domain-containing protein n=1 Tax=Peronospora farinosa TaxID=134698 RepID=A0AAV0UN62_9STRA|nr:unnamed protein product [Peronospora farinosa]CAI5737205.1 unnamed protein product [Peronospora farinosa]
MIAFTVYKSSKYLFDCVSATDVTQSQSCMTVNIDVFEALQLNAVDVVKRMDYVEVDKLIASCREHPPQTIVMPATHGDIAPFQKFVKYLKARKRAGVVLLADGRLLILMPLENDDSRLRCVVVNATPPTENSAGLPSHVTTIRIDEAAAGPALQREPQVQSANAMLPPLHEQKRDKRRRARARPNNRTRSQQEDVDDTTPQDSVTEQFRHIQAEVAAPTFTPNKEVTMLHSLPRLERATRIAQLRQEYEAFHKYHYDVLQGWSRSNFN